MVDNLYMGAMHLAHRRDGMQTECFVDESPVFGNGLRRITDMVAEIQAVVRRDADATVPIGDRRLDSGCEFGAEKEHPLLAT